LVATYSRRDRAATNFIIHDLGAAHAGVGKSLTHDGRYIVTIYIPSGVKPGRWMAVAPVSSNFTGTERQRL